jgi:hypothetical protein
MHIIEGIAGLKVWRGRMGFTQAQAAQDLGLSHGSFRNLESAGKGGNPMSFKLAAALEQIHKITASRPHQPTTLP